MSSAAFTILGVAGSLRRQSYNRALLRAAAELVPPHVAIETFDIGRLPHFNQDVEAEGDPPEVRELKERLRAADALLIATPEYNWSTPGVLKNAIDWASRPPSSTPLKHKPVAIMGASPGLLGTARAQLALRQALIFPDAWVLPNPQVVVMGAADKFDENGSLTDERTRGSVRNLVEALVAWARRLGPD
ncbi:MAG: NAD(P)H-dependent oxidoreductase [Chloroflexi bacterium]|nr:NAD(P)H-dependent oxidoreductase [Chloroflexota bacterium]